jgi:uncharacterized membrane protein YqiK
MNATLGETLSAHWMLISTFLTLLFGFLFFRQILWLFGVVIINEGYIGIVNKKFVLFGENKTLPDGKIIALNGEAGIQADTLPSGIHFWLWPWQYEVSLEGFYTVPQGKVGLVEAKDGAPLPAGRVFAKKVACDSFQNARAFLQNGGERGAQIAIIPPGTYRVNTAAFILGEAPCKEVREGMVGIVTTSEGKSLPTGEIAGKEVQGHNMFQDGQAFLDNGGYKGLQEQVILAGRYFFHPKFVTVQEVEMTTVPIAHAGVVISYVGDTGVDVSGPTFQHGNLFKKGQKGVWAEPLDPGMYPINPHTHKVECVPTANVVLNWATGKSEAHKLDDNLSTIKVRSSDGFTFNLDVSQIIHIPRNDAPMVIQRFGGIKNLVSQVLEPTIGNYFRNAAQNSDVIEFLDQRQQRQDDAKKQIGEALMKYNVMAIDTLIGDIVPPETLMKTLTDRKLAQQEKITYDTQRLAEETRKELEQARAIAETQKKVVDAERKVQIADYDAQSAVKKAEGEAKSKTIVAEADAMVTVTVGNAEAAKTKAIGSAEADVITLKINSMESGNYAAIEVAKALAVSGKLTPDIMVGGGDGGGASIANVFMANILSETLKGKTAKTPSTPGIPEKK